MPSPRRIHPLALVAACIVTACSDGGGGGSTGPDPAEQIARVEVRPASLPIDLDASGQLSATVYNGLGDPVGDLTGAGVSWTSSDPAVAGVTGGGPGNSSTTAQVTGLSVGTATITAAVGPVSGTSTVSVRDPYPPAAPTALGVQALSNTEVQLAWNDTSGNEDAFVVLRATATTEFVEVARLAADRTEFVDEGLTPQTEYRYRLEACNENGCTPATSTGDGANGGDGGAEVVVRTFATLEITTAQLPDGTEGVPYEVQLEHAGPDEAPSWSLTEGELPPGLEFSPQGRISGIPSTPGARTFGVLALAAGQQVQASFTLDISEEILPPVIRTERLPEGGVGADYDVSFVADLGDGAYAWRVAGEASLPPGLALDASSGRLSGVPTQGGSFAFVIEVASAGFMAQAEFTLEVAEALSFRTVTLPSAVLERRYEQVVLLDGGRTNLLTLASGALPEGLALDSLTRRISGTPVAAQSGESFTLQASNELGQRVVAEFSIDVYEPLTLVTNELAMGAVDLPYEATLAAVGGDGDYTFSSRPAAAPGAAPGSTSSSTPSSTSGSTPAVATVSVAPGLELAADGTLTGTPTRAGEFEFGVQVSSADGQTFEATLSLLVEASDVVLETTELPAGRTDVDYEQTLAVSGGDGRSYTFAISAGALPDGLALDAETGVIAGVPTTGGKAVFEVQVESPGATAATGELSITIESAPVEPLSFDTEELPLARASVEYLTELAVSGGRGPYTFSVTSGSMPTGLDLGAATGRISGSALGAGESNISIRVLDAAENEITRSFTLRVCEAPLQLAPGERYTTAVSGVCGTVLDGAAADYRIGLVARSLTTNSLVRLTDGLRLTTTVGTPGDAFSAPAAAPFARVGSTSPLAIPRELADRIARTEALHHRLNEADLALQRARGGHPNPGGYRLLPEPEPETWPETGPEGAAARVQPVDPPETATYWVYDETLDERVQHTFTRRGLTASAVYYEMDGMPVAEQVTQTRIDALLDYYEQWGVAIIEDAFGGLAPSGMTTNFVDSRPAADLDQNGGRIVVLQIPDDIMLSGAAAYVSSCDRYPRLENVQSGFYCTGSNEAEVTYFAAPTSDFYLGTLVHEVKHISSHGWALYSSRGYNPSWIEEGTAEIAKEKSSRDAVGLADGAEAGYADLYPGGSRSRESYGMATVYGRAARYLYHSPNAGLVDTPEDSNSTYYGASWLFHRFLTDAWGSGDEDAFHSALNTGGRDVSRIEAVTGQSIETLIGAFAAAIGVEGLAKEATATHRFDSYDFVGISQSAQTYPDPWPFFWYDEPFSSTEWSFSTVYRHAPFFFDLATTGDAVRLDVTTTTGAAVSSSHDVVLLIWRK